jgi:Toxin SymE, type I toxin-antitoxin system
MKSRQLRVSYRCPESQSRASLRLPVPMPFLRLQGRWLDQAGFAIGADVQVQVEHGRLVLEVLGPQAETA